MPKVKESFLVQLDRLNARFPGREMISIKEACEVTGFCRETLLADKTFPVIRPGKVSNAKIAVSLVGLASWLSKGAVE